MKNHVDQMREFTRFYTGLIGLLNRHILNSEFSLPEARVLFELNQQENGVASDVMQSLQMDRGYLSRLLHQFEKSGLITRQKSKEDGRASVIQLTTKGKKAFAQLNSASQKQVKGILQPLSASHQDKLVSHMSEIKKILSPLLKPRLDDITLRTELRPGDIGDVIQLHGKLYKDEYQYEIAFETYVAQGLLEFYQQYDPKTNRVWICEHNRRMIGFLLLMNRGKAAQLRYFLLEPEYRGIGLGKKLMNLYMAFLKQAGYTSSYLWTTHELPAAAHLYTTYGFKLSEEKKSTSFGKPLREQRYDLTL